MWIKQYRKHHWKHHNHLGTHADTEVSYHSPINLGEIISGLTGIYIIKILSAIYILILVITLIQNVKVLKHITHIFTIVL